MVDECTPVCPDLSLLNMVSSVEFPSMVYYVLNVWVSQRLTGWKWILQASELSSKASEWRVDHYNRDLTNGTSVLIFISETLKSYFYHGRIYRHHFYHGRTPEALMDNESNRNPIKDCPVSKAMRNKLLSFIKHPIIALCFSSLSGQR